MALETVVFQQDSFTNYSFNDILSYGLDFKENREVDFGNEYLDSGRSLACSSSPETCAFEGEKVGVNNQRESAGPTQGRKKRRRRIRSTKNEEQIESQRMTHIAVERNRRKQMNDYLAVIRSLMPPSYSHRGDQASTVGGAINFVKELEQLLQYLEAQKENINLGSCSGKDIFSDFFTFPQYSTCSTSRTDSRHELPGEKPSAIADVEVAMVDTHATIKILSRRQPKQLLKLVDGFYSLGLNILHLNVTTANSMAFYSVSVKVGEECHLGTVNEMANVVHEMIGKIQKESISC